MERAVYRIIDANFNRAREAIRVIEEYCRFLLNSRPLSERAKEIRHQLCRAVESLDVNLLLCSRDTYNDVGIGQAVTDQHRRINLDDCLIAACKRLTEALRVLAECVQIQNNTLSQTFEQLRYRSYILEKEIVLFSKPAERFKKVGLYVVISSDDGRDVLSIAGKCAAGGADCIQLRAKNCRDNAFFSIATDFVKLCRDSGVISIINARIDIAVAAGADGIHLGQGDLPLDCVHKLELTPLIIGKSTHSIEQLHLVIPQLPTYVALGPIFPNPAKPDTNAAGLGFVLQALKVLENTGIGHTVFGGITTENIDSVLAAGAQCVAVCPADMASDDPAEICRIIKQMITATGHNYSSYRDIDINQK
jgi:thiamine-phosphate pyrophosphorylase